MNFRNKRIFMRFFYVFFDSRFLIALSFGFFVGFVSSVSAVVDAFDEFDKSGLSVCVK